MKSLKDLEALKQRAQEKMKVREGQGGTKVVVTMGTCGIANGAREVVTAFMEELKKRNMYDVLVNQAGCIGLCDQEPVVIVTKDGKETAYGSITSERVEKIIEQHLLQGQPISNWVINV